VPTTIAYRCRCQVVKSLFTCSTICLLAPCKPCLERSPRKGPISPIIPRIGQGLISPLSSAYWGSWASAAAVAVAVAVAVASGTTAKRSYVDRILLFPQSPLCKIYYFNSKALYSQLIPYLTLQNFHFTVYFGSKALYIQTILLLNLQSLHFTEYLGYNAVYSQTIPLLNLKYKNWSLERDNQTQNVLFHHNQEGRRF
jgi:hypothetical protein